MPRPHGTRIYIGYARFLFWEFRWPLVVFSTLVFVVGCILKHNGCGAPTYAETFYGVFCMIFFETLIDFPADKWYLQPLFFLVPIIGLGAIADSVVRLAYLVITQKRKLQEWHVMVASLHRHHIIVVGVGKVGLRVIKGLVALGENVVAVESAAESSFVDEVLDLGIPVIQGDGRERKVLVKAGCLHARSIIAVTDDDLTNLDAALTAQDANAKIRVVLRLFDETLAMKFGEAFKMPTISIAHVSAPAFIAAAIDRQIYHEIPFGGETLNLTDLQVRVGSSIIGRTIGQIQHEAGINIIVHKDQFTSRVNPGHDIVVRAGDHLLLIAPPECLRLMEQSNKTS